MSLPYCVFSNIAKTLRNTEITTIKTQINTAYVYDTILYTNALNFIKLHHVCEYDIRLYSPLTYPIYN